MGLLHTLQVDRLSHCFKTVWRRLQPDESIYMKVAVKKPGLEMTPIMSELDLTYKVCWLPSTRRDDSVEDMLALL